MAGELAEPVLPMAQRTGVAGVDLDPVEQRPRAVMMQPLVEAAAEAAEAIVGTIAQRQHRVLQAVQREGLVEHVAGESEHMVRRVALAGRADDEQGALMRAQRLRIDPMQRQRPHRNSRSAQGLRGVLGELLGESGLAGPGQQHRIGRDVGLHRTRSCLRARLRMEGGAQAEIRQQHQRGKQPATGTRRRHPPRVRLPLTEGEQCRQQRQHDQRIAEPGPGRSGLHAHACSSAANPGVIRSP